MEQIPLDLSLESETKVESLSISELLLLYNKKIGVPARTDSKDVLTSAINDPEAELTRLRKIDSEQDRRELAAPYKR